MDPLVGLNPAKLSLNQPVTSISLKSKYYLFAGRNGSIA
jgi:hypothetical protein